MADRGFDNTLAKRSFVFLNIVVAGIKTPLSLQIRFGDSWKEHDSPTEPDRIASLPSPRKELAEKLFSFENMHFNDPQKCQVLEEAADYACSEISPARSRLVVKMQFGLTRKRPTPMTTSEIAQMIYHARKETRQSAAAGIARLSGRTDILQRIYEMISRD